MVYGSKKMVMKTSVLLTFKYQAACDYLAHSSVSTTFSCNSVCIKVSLFPAVSKQFLILSALSKNQSQVFMSELVV